MFDGAHDNVVGGTTPAARNVFSGNDVGVYIADPTTINNSVLGNYIGTSPDGTTAVPNDFEGIAIIRNAKTQNNTIGRLPCRSSGETR